MVDYITTDLSNNCHFNIVQGTNMLKGCFKHQLIPYFLRFQKCGFDFYVFRAPTSTLEELGKVDSRVSPMLK